MPTDLDSAMVQMNSLKRLLDAAIEYSLNKNASKTVALLFGKKTGYDAVKDRLKLTIRDDLAESTRNLDLIMYNSFRYRLHISNCIKKSYATLRLLYITKKSLNR